LGCLCWSIAVVRRGASNEDRAGETSINDRFSVGRLSGSSQWSPCAVRDDTARIPRANCQPRAIGRAARATADSARFGTAGAARALHWNALRDLRVADRSPRVLDLAISSLEDAARTTPSDAAILNDLAVAHLMRAEHEQAVRPLLHALDAVERGAAIAPGNPALLFNRALILDRLYLSALARDAWSSYLRIERDVAWRQEAESHVRRLAARQDTASRRLDAERLMNADMMAARIDTAVHETPQSAREAGFGLLGQWGLAVQQGDSIRAGRALALIRQIARVSSSVGGDGTLARVAAAFDESSPQANRRAADAYVEFTTGFALYGRGAYEDAARALLRAEKDMRDTRIPFAGWASLYGALAEINLGKYPAAEHRLDAVLAMATPAENALRGKAIWALGLTKVRRGAYEAAIRRYREAIPYFAAIRESENLGTLAALLAEALELAGQETAARGEELRCIQLLSSSGGSIFRTNALGVLARYARNDRLHTAALTIMDEVLAVVSPRERPQIVAWAYGVRARGELASGRRELAKDNLSKARTWIARIAPGRGRDQIAADVSLVDAELLLATDSRAARDSLLTIVRAYRATNSEIKLPEALRLAATASRDAGDTAAARRTPHGSDRAGSGAAGRVSHSGASRDVLRDDGEGVRCRHDLELQSGRPELALGYLESGRAAAWGARVLPVSRYVADIQRRLPRNAAAIEYGVLADAACLWTITANSVTYHPIPIGRDSLLKLVARFNSEAIIDEPTKESARAVLFDLLVRPAIHELAGSKTLLVIPDRELSVLPFAALWDRESDRYLLSAFVIHTLPSATFLPVAERRSVAPRHGRRQALVVGDPAFDSGALAGLPRLQGAAREAQQIADVYGPSSVVLTDTRARRDEVLSQLKSAEVFHFAGHAITDLEQPERSFLVLAADTTLADGILQAREIGQLRLSSTKLVVLSACRSLGTRSTHVGPLAGLAYSFLRAGVPGTISSLWDVSDEGTTELFLSFHRHLNAGASPADALRAAQLESLQSPRAMLRAPRIWAAFVYSGP
jgi:CHAT domain-containing protein/tetratricopeptide (TPR) repeat protein